MKEVAAESGEQMSDLVAEVRSERESELAAAHPRPRPERVPDRPSSPESL
ncbi:MAG: hypothetical protein HY900_23860 [Deltaproteobacteria bacterium]|nr:hypothetical protein [Deltaproteobacteria bacterium]